MFIDHYWTCTEKARVKEYHFWSKLFKNICDIKGYNRFSMSHNFLIFIFLDKLIVNIPPFDHRFTKVVLADHLIFRYIGYAFCIRVQLLTFFQLISSHVKVFVTVIIIIYCTCVLSTVNNRGGGELMIVKSKSLIAQL